MQKPSPFISTLPYAKLVVRTQREKQYMLASDEKTINKVIEMLKNSIPNCIINDDTTSNGATLSISGQALYLSWDIDDPNRFFYESLEYYQNKKGYLIPDPNRHSVKYIKGRTDLELPYNISPRSSKYLRIKTIDLAILKQQLKKETLCAKAKIIFTNYFVNKTEILKNCQERDTLNELANYYDLEKSKLEEAIKKDRASHTKHSTFDKSNSIIEGKVIVKMIPNGRKKMQEIKMLAIK